LTAKFITNVNQEQEKFNKILGFAQKFVADSQPWLIKFDNSTIKLAGFSIRPHGAHWYLERSGSHTLIFSTKSAALAYCAFCRKHQYYLAKRTHELDHKLEILTLEIRSRQQALKRARKTSSGWKLDLHQARYLENLSQYQNTRQELKKHIAQSKLLWRQPALNVTQA
jgi:hypothetical protein